MKIYSQFIVESVETKTAKVYHGGDLGSGKKPVVTFWTPNLEMAKSYVNMTKDRFGGSPKIHEKTLTIKVAPWAKIQREARNAGIDPEEGTPASVFDVELHGEMPVRRMVFQLVQSGYTGAILDDIGYGVQIADEAWIEFFPK